MRETRCLLQTHSSEDEADASVEELADSLGMWGLLEGRTLWVGVD